jgi:1-acyl-sn-glycerol-3-phosphate acyltransferase
LFVALTMPLIGTYIKIVLIGHKEGVPLKPWQRTVIKYPSMLIARILMYGSTIIWVNRTKVRYDYSKYLGPDWKLTFDNPSTIVENHSSWMDIVTSIYLKAPGFAAKEGIRNWPFCAAIAHGNSTFYLNRATNTKEDREFQVRLFIIIIIYSYKKSTGVKKKLRKASTLLLFSIPKEELPTTQSCLSSKEELSEDFTLFNRLP